MPAPEPLPLKPNSLGETCQKAPGKFSSHGLFLFPGCLPQELSGKRRGCVVKAIWQPATGLSASLDIALGLGIWGKKTEQLHVTAFAFNVVLAKS